MDKARKVFPRILDPEQRQSLSCLSCGQPKQDLGPGYIQTRCQSCRRDFTIANPSFATPSEAEVSHA